MVTKPTIWPNGRFGVPQITPYTYRDGHTLLELIKALRDHVVEQLHPSLQHAIDQLVADVESEYDTAHNRYVDGVQEFQRIHDAFMSDVNAKLVALNDTAITDLFHDTTSKLSQVLRSVFATGDDVTNLETAQNAFRHSMETAMETHRTDVNSRVDDAVDTVNTRVDDAMDTVNTQLSVVSTKIENYGLTPYDFGAIGDGVADDTEALQAWLDHGNGHFAPGTYRTTDKLEVERDDVVVDGQGAVTILPGAQVDTLVIRGQRGRVTGITIDGGKQAAYGIRMYGEHHTIADCVIKHLHYPTNARAINLQGKGGYLVTRCTIDDVYTPGRDDIGKGTGMTRAIAVYNPDGIMEHPSRIEHNRISRIFGQEGDAITILCPTRSNGVRDFAYVTIANNEFNGASRRYIKLQASFVTVMGNSIRDTTNESYTDISGVIVSIDGRNNKIVSNFIDSTPLGTPINVTGSYSKPQYCEVSNNNVSSSDNSIAIRASQLERIAIASNTIRIFGRGRAISVFDTEYGNVSNNTAHGTTTNASASEDETFVVLASCRYVLLANNTDSIYPIRKVSAANRGYYGRSIGNVSM